MFYCIAFRCQNIRPLGLQFKSPLKYSLKYSLYSSKLKSSLQLILVIQKPKKETMFTRNNHKITDNPIRNHSDRQRMYKTPNLHDYYNFFPIPYLLTIASSSSTHLFLFWDAFFLSHLFFLHMSVSLVLFLKRSM